MKRAGAEDAGAGEQVPPQPAALTPDGALAGGAAVVALPHSPERVTAADIAAIGCRLRALDPGIALRAVAGGTRPGWVDRPPARTLAVSLNVVPVGDALDGWPGPRFLARPVPKLAQLRALDRVGVALPVTATLTARTPVTEELFGPFVMVKTTALGTERAKGIELVRTAVFERHRERLLARYAAEAAQGFFPVVQAHVPTGPRPTHMRVLTCFGRAILMYRTTARAPFDPGRMGETAGGEATSNAGRDRERRLEMDPEMQALGEAAARAFPDTPVVGVDVVRSETDGRLVVLEANMGNIAPLSAPICGALREDLGARAVLDQFGAYDVIALEIARRVPGAAI